VVEMDACHVLLGRPWLFDRKVLHDGMENTYEFNKDGQCYRLEPMVEEETTQWTVVILEVVVAKVVM
jgi:hypothetical protein